MEKQTKMVSFSPPQVTRVINISVQSALAHVLPLRPWVSTTLWRHRSRPRDLKARMCLSPEHGRWWGRVWASESTRGCRIGWSVLEELCLSNPPRHKTAVYLTRPAFTDEERTFVALSQRLALARVVHLRRPEPNVGAQRRRLCIVERRETGSAGTRSPYTVGDVIGTFLWQDRCQGCPGRTLANGRQRL